MNRLNEINEYIKKEYSNLTKSINRTRSLQGINEKTDIFIKEYKIILHKFEHRLDINELNNKVEEYQAVVTQLYHFDDIKLM